MADDKRQMLQELVESRTGGGLLSSVQQQNEQQTELPAESPLQELVERQLQGQVPTERFGRVVYLRPQNDPYLPAGFRVRESSRDLLRQWSNALRLSQQDLVALALDMLFEELQRLAPDR